MSRKKTCRHEKSGFCGVHRSEWFMTSPSEYTPKCRRDWRKFKGKRFNFTYVGTYWRLLGVYSNGLFSFSLPFGSPKIFYIIKGHTACVACRLGFRCTFDVKRDLIRNKTTTFAGVDGGRRAQEYRKIFPLKILLLQLLWLPWKGSTGDGRIRV